MCTQGPAARSCSGAVVPPVSPPRGARYPAAAARAAGRRAANSDISVTARVPYAAAPLVQRALTTTVWVCCIRVVAFQRRCSAILCQHGHGSVGGRARPRGDRYGDRPARRVAAGLQMTLRPAAPVVSPARAEDCAQRARDLRGGYYISLYVLPHHPYNLLVATGSGIFYIYMPSRTDV